MSPRAEPASFDPDKFRFHLLPRHLIALAVAFLACVGYAYELRAEVSQLGMRLDGWADGPGIVKRVTTVEDNGRDLKKVVDELRLEVQGMRTFIQTQQNADVEDRRKLNELLIQLEKQLRQKGR